MKIVSRVVREIGRIRARLLVVNLVVLIVPMAGLEFARIHEKQLLDALERDMRNQVAITRATLEGSVAAHADACGASREGACADPLSPIANAEPALREAARTTRTRIRVVDRRGTVVADSHRDGAPEGPEATAPAVLPFSSEYRDVQLSTRYGAREREQPEVDLAHRTEVRDALAGKPSARTRVRDAPPSVLLFVTEPLRSHGVVVGVVYAVRSTTPVLFELYRIRKGLIQVLAVALVFTLFVTLALAWTISRPLARLSHAAKRIADGEPNVHVPVSGTGEIRELAESVAAMTEKLDARARYISQFAADVAHEFKSPLTSIRGAAELLAEGAADDPAARAKFLGNIDEDVARLDRLVTQLLELSRFEASRDAMLALDLEALVSRAVERATTADVPIELDYRAPHRMVKARENDLLAALLNVLENAVRFSPVGEVVRVEVTETADAIRIAIRDRGPGIAKENLARVFDRFFTTDRESHGTGLGLAIAKTVVEAHGGAIRAESEIGGGATFVLELPRKAFMAR